MGLHASACSDVSAGEAPERATGEPLLVPGRTCWRIERAEQVAFLVDGEEYFGAIRSALAKARHSILILGWDIDSRMRLVPDGARDGLPEPLGEFLNEIVRRTRGLRGYVLSWDFAMLYAMEREWLPIYKLDWRTHRRLSFRLDNTHPVGASHHQKVVVIDDAVAFVGGYDLTRCRYDTSAHARHDPRRVDHRGTPYAPFHDVGMVVSGDCAQALGDLARERWFRATGRRPRERPSIAPAEAWPDGIEPVASDVEVAISRTEPPQDGRTAVSEIKALHLDAIASARRFVFAENQYFTSRTIADAFARRLEADDGPEIAVLSPYTQSGWLEISTMGVLRARIHRVLRAADRHGRYRLYYPRLDALDSEHGCLNVHSKVLIVDDALLSIGSSNLSDRSLGIDTECNLSLEAREDPQLREVIAGLRDRLLAEHLGCTPREVADAVAREGKLHRAIEALSRDGARSLVSVDPTADATLDALAPDRHVFDPEQPLDPDAIVEDLVPHEESRDGARTRLAVTLLGVLALAGMALAWRFTPLGEWLAFDRLLAIGTAWHEQAWAPFFVVLAFVIAGLIVFPLTVLVVATAMVFGPVLGPVYTIAGATFSAAVTFAIGRRLGRETVRRLAGQRVNDLSRRLAKRGLLAVVFMRMLPIAPYTIVNVVAGASHIRWADFLLGTVIGLLPGVAALSFFVDRALAAIREPGALTFVLLVVAALVLVGLAWTLRRRLRGRNARTAMRAQVAHGS